MKKIFAILGLLILVGCNDVPTYNYVTCKYNCQQQGQESGTCVANRYVHETDMTLGNCVAEGSYRCQNLGLCQCVCGDDLTDSLQQDSEGMEEVFQPTDFDSVVIEGLFDDLKSETRMDFGEAELVAVDWSVDGGVTKISAKQVSAWNQEANGEMLVKMFFEMHGWGENLLNNAVGTYQSQLGWQKDNVVCLLNSEIFVEAGVPSGDNLYRVACGLIN